MAYDNLLLFSMQWWPLPSSRTATIQLPPDGCNQLFFSFSHEQQKTLEHSFSQHKSRKSHSHCDDIRGPIDRLIFVLLSCAMSVIYCGPHSVDKNMLSLRFSLPPPRPGVYYSLKDNPNIATRHTAKQTHHRAVGSAQEVMKSNGAWHSSAFVTDRWKIAQAQPSGSIWLKDFLLIS